MCIRDRFQEVHKSGSVIYIAVGGKYSGYIVMSDKVKKDVKEMLVYLKKHCQAVTVMVTGDTPVSYTHLDVYKRQILRRYGEWDISLRWNNARIN